MNVYDAPGLTADWLNGWLAAIGVTVLLPDVRLSWSDDAIPIARFHHPTEVDFVSAAAAALPTERSLAGSVIARRLDGATHEFARNVTLEAFQERAALERAGQSHHLAASVTDLVRDAHLDRVDLPHGAFDPATPHGETLWSRVNACVEKLGQVPDRAERVAAALAGAGARAQLNGLGFDSRRLPSGLHPAAATKVYVDPIVETLCFEALRLFPVRGNGRASRQRGWLGAPSQRGAFTWIAWSPALDRWAIDALLDHAQIAGARPPVIARYQVVPYQPSGASDTTRAYFSERSG